MAGLAGTMAKPASKRVRRRETVRLMKALDLVIAIDLQERLYCESFAFAMANRAAWRKITHWLKGSPIRHRKERQ
jgi:hypothetical protein